jgi:transposase-like protein
MWQAWESLANRELGLSAWRERNQHQNNRVENSHQPIRKPERNLRPFKSPGFAQPVMESHTGSQGINFWSPHSQPRPSRHRLSSGFSSSALS